MENSGLVTITEAEYANLCRDSFFLDCLKVAGINNWVGYSDAIDIRDEHELGGEDD